MPYEIKKGAGKCKAGQWAVVKKGTDTALGCHDTEASAKKQLAALYANESETPVNRKLLSEAIQAVEATPVAGKPGHFLIELINPGWGSSGYYGATVLEAAGKARVFPAGLHMYKDHPSTTEQFDRPERSIDDLRAVLVEDATWNGTALVAEALVYASHAAQLAERADAIGVSIRAYAETEQGEAEGRRGLIVTELVEAISVDFVTHAGRGGKILQVIESAPPATVVKRAIGHGVSEATANELRERLQDLLRETYGGEKSWVWVRDFDDTHVWYEFETPDECGTYQLDYSVDAEGNVTLSGSPIEVRTEIKYVPVTPDPAGHPTTEESEETPMAKIQIEEAEYQRLVEESGRVKTLEAERDTAIQERDVEKAARAKSDAALAESDRNGKARGIIAASAKKASTEFTALEVRGLLAELPVTGDGQLDEAKFTTTVDEAATAKAEEAGAGTVRGFGRPSLVVPSGGDTISEADAREQIRARRNGTTVKGA